MSTIPIILDTDVAMGIHDEDIDDGFALAEACTDPCLDLKLVTTVDGGIDVDSATNITHDLLMRLGKTIDVSRGADRPLTGTRRKFWGTLNDTRFNPAEEVPAAMKIVKILRISEDSKLTIIAIGPLTNIAIALLLDPSIVHNISRIVIMGGRFFSNQWGDDIPGEFNMWADPEAASIVLGAGIDTWLVGTDVTFKTTMNREEAGALYSQGGIFGKYAAECALDWIDALNARSESEEIDEFCLHDPLTVAATSHPELLTWEDHNVHIVLDGEARGTCFFDDNRGHSCHVAKDVDISEYKRYLFERLSAV